MLLCQLSKHNKDLAKQFQPVQFDAQNEPSEDPALKYYAEHTAQIEIVRHDRTMEQIIFPKLDICGCLSKETKNHVYKTAERDEQKSKLNDFFNRHEALLEEMKWQKSLQGN